MYYEEEAVCIFAIIFMRDTKLSFSERIVKNKKRTLKYIENKLLYCGGCEEDILYWNSLKNEVLKIKINYENNKI